MPEKTLSDVAVAYLDKAVKCLNSANTAISISDYDVAANRSYYCIFNSMKAVLAFDGFKSKKHGEVIGSFRKDYIKTGIFPVEFSDVIKDAFETRNCCDYDEVYIAVADDVLRQVKNARNFFAAVKEYVDRKILP